MSLTGLEQASWLGYHIESNRTRNRKENKSLVKQNDKLTVNKPFKSCKNYKTVTKTDVVSKIHRNPLPKKINTRPSDLKSGGNVEKNSASVY